MSLQGLAVPELFFTGAHFGPAMELSFAIRFSSEARPFFAAHATVTFAWMLFLAAQSSKGYWRGFVSRASSSLVPSAFDATIACYCAQEFWLGRTLFHPSSYRHFYQMMAVSAALFCDSKC